MFINISPLSSFYAFIRRHYSITKLHSMTLAYLLVIGTCSRCICIVTVSGKLEQVFPV